MSARYVAARGIADIERGGYSNIAADKAINDANLTQADAALASYLIYGVLQRKLTLDGVIEAICDKPLKKLHPFVLAVLRTGAFQLLFTDKIPPSAAVNESVKLIKKTKQGFAAGFVNAVLRKISRNKDSLRKSIENGDLTFRYSCPKEITEELIRDYGKDFAESFLKSSLQTPKTYACINRYAADSDTLPARLAAKGIQCEPVNSGGFTIKNAGSLEKLEEFREGAFFIQDIASQTAVAALEIKKGMRVLDVCAAPGGKSFTAAQYLEGEGEIVSCDIHEHRVGLIASGARRLKITILTAKQNDASLFRPDFGLFDRIICDVPCSGLGVIRRKPEIKYKTISKELPDIQYRILETSSEYLAPDGWLMYSTCTLRKEENEQVVRKFIQNGGFEILTERTLAPHSDGSDGFYFCVIKRKNGG